MRRYSSLQQIGWVMVALLLVGTTGYGDNGHPKTAPEVIQIRPDAHAPQSAQAAADQTAGVPGRGDRRHDRRHG